MCVQTRLVFNKYIHKAIRVPCGKCEACQQAKANKRAERIRNHSVPGEISLMVTLTYSNKFVPYVFQSDLYRREPEIYVFRNFTSRLLRTGKHEVYDNWMIPIDSLPCPENPHLKYFPSLTKMRGCMGILYYRDIQLFMKRLRQILKRNYGIKEPKLSYWVAGEYGSKSKRPHWHMSLHFPKDIEKDVRSALVKAWPYGDLTRSRRRVEIAKNASSYLAGYITKSAHLPKVFEDRYYKQVHHSSKGYGVRLECFSLDQILECVESRFMSYCKQVIRDGVPSLVNVPIPKYVINRFFPKFKGYSLFTDSQILELLRLPQRYRSLFTNGTKIEYETFWIDEKTGIKYPEKKVLIDNLEYYGDYIDFDESDFHRWTVRLWNCFYSYSLATGKTIYDYAIDYVRVWNCYNHFLNRLCYNEDTDFSDFYENIGEYIDRPEVVPTLDLTQRFTLNPNERKDQVKKTWNLVELYHKKDVIKSVNNAALSEFDDEF